MLRLIDSDSEDFPEAFGYVGPEFQEPDTWSEPASGLGSCEAVEADESFSEDMYAQTSLADLVELDPRLGTDYPDFPFPATDEDLPLPAEKSGLESIGPMGLPDAADEPMISQHPSYLTPRLSMLASSMMHALIILLAAWCSASPSKGVCGQGGEVIMVRFVAQEDCVPVDETPASMDSLASSPSVAGRKEPDKNDQPEQVREPDKILAKVDQEQPAKEKEEPEKKEEKELELNLSGDGPINSVASVASVASEERRMLAAGGSEMEDFQSRILAAIREAIYFPKEALVQRRHGETIVQFTVYRDGSVGDLSVKQRSGSTVLDDAALAIIRKAAQKFPNMPDRSIIDKASYVVPIHFKEKRSRASN